MGKTRDLFKKIRDTKGTFHAKMGSIKDRNGRDLTEAEDIKNRWQEYTELYKKDLHDPYNHDGVITDLVLCLPLLLPPSIFPSIRVFSNESAFHIRWPKDWSFSFS